MELIINKNPNTIQKHPEPVVAVYLEVTEEGGIEVCADSDTEWGYCLATITSDGRFKPNKVGIKSAGLKLS